MSLRSGFARQCMFSAPGNGTWSWDSSGNSKLEYCVVRDQLEALVNQMIDKGVSYEDAVGEFQRKFIKGVLEKNNGNQSKAARVLGIHRNTLGRKVEEL